MVRDLGSMERFYRDVIGCRPVRRSRVPVAVGVPAGLGGELDVVWPQVPSGGCVKLILPSSPAVPACTISRPLVGFTQVASAVTVQLAVVPASSVVISVVTLVEMV